MDLNGSRPCPPAQSDQRIGLSIVIPTFNEAGRVSRGFDELRAAFDRGLVDANEIEVVIVDDGSTDGTSEVAEEHLDGLNHSQIIRLATNRGKGAAIRAGVTAARGDNLMYMDVDMAVPPSHVADLLNALETADVVIGSRTHPESSRKDSIPYRRLMGRTFQRLARTTAGLPYRDTQCGFKAFRTPVARLLFHYSGTDRFAFDVELLAVAHRLGLLVTEVPVRWRHVTGSRIRPIADPLSMVRDLLRIQGGHPAVTNVTGVSLSAVRGFAPPTEIARALLGPTMPVVRWNRSAALVLFPLCDGRTVASMVAELVRALPGSSIETMSFSAADLQELPGLFSVCRGSITAVPDLESEEIQVSISST